jgi:cobalt-precorrin-5B (C1)-methyltransferase
MRDKQGTRTGFTTGACATACVRAALLGLAGRWAKDVEITLPKGQRARFAISRVESGEGWALAATLKDAGDDPDVTHGAEIRARVHLLDEPALVRFAQGQGVGRVTLPGLGLPLGEPAINPVPRKMMTEHALAALAELGWAQKGVEITVSVKDGEALAKKTLNPRLGILGGISILGRSGIVHPYSHAAYIASITQAVDVALAQGAEALVLTTGGQTEDFARRLFPGLAGACFVQMGDFAAQALRHCARRQVRQLRLVAQMGKAVKLAQGMANTHASRGPVDLKFLSALAQAAGATPAAAAALAQASTARHAFEMSLDQAWAPGFYLSIAEHSARVARGHCPGADRVESWLLDFEGNVLAKAALPAAQEGGKPWSKSI